MNKFLFHSSATVKSQDAKLQMRSTHSEIFVQFSGMTNVHVYACVRVPGVLSVSYQLH